MKIHKKKIECADLLSICAFFRRKRGFISCIETDADSLGLLGYWMVIKGGTERVLRVLRYLGRIGWIQETGPKEMSSFCREKAHACLT